jgi:hypothetical protein
VADCAYGEQVTPANSAVEVYERATNQFAAAIFLKPAEATNADFACQLAPLIIQQVSAGQISEASFRDASGAPAPGPDVPASSFVIRHSSLSTLRGASNNISGATRSHPAVFYATDSVLLNGHAHPRFSYQWLYTSSNPAGQPPPLPTQGVRIVLDARGQPATWEILADTSGLRLIFVSQSLEAAAEAEFGKALPGRRYAIERGVTQAPAVVVPRVLDDGPVAMGPIIYLSEGTRDVSTLICRCMPAQVKQLVGTRTFDLLPLERGELDARLATTGMVSNAPPLLWPVDSRIESRLDHCLRLPSGF